MSNALEPGRSLARHLHTELLYENCGCAALFCNQERIGLDCPTPPKAGLAHGDKMISDVKIEADRSVVLDRCCPSCQLVHDEQIREFNAPGGSAGDGHADRMQSLEFQRVHWFETPTSPKTWIYHWHPALDEADLKTVYANYSIDDADDDGHFDEDVRNDMDMRMKLFVEGLEELSLQSPRHGPSNNWDHAVDPLPADALNSTSYGGHFAWLPQETAALMISLSAGVAEDEADDDETEEHDDTSVLSTCSLTVTNSDSEGSVDLGAVSDVSDSSFSNRGFARNVLRGPVPILIMTAAQRIESLDDLNDSFTADRPEGRVADELVDLDDLGYEGGDEE